MKSPDRYQGIFSILFPGRSRDRNTIEATIQPITLGFPTLGTGELNVDHMGQQSIIPADNMIDAFIPPIRALPPVEVLRSEVVRYFGYMGGMKMRGSAAAVVEIQAGEKTEKLLAIEYAGMVLAVRRVRQDVGEIIKLNLNPEILDRYQGRGVQAFSNFSREVDGPWKNLNTFNFKN